MRNQATIATATAATTHHLFLDMITSGGEAVWKRLFSPTDANLEDSHLFRGWPGLSPCLDLNQRTV